MQTGVYLCQLFATILLFCFPTKPEALWLDFCPLICDDLHYHLVHMGYQNPTEETVYDYGLFLLNSILLESGHSLHDFYATSESKLVQRY
jgi:hypothetical protein